MSRSGSRAHSSGNLRGIYGNGSDNKGSKSNILPQSPYARPVTTNKIGDRSALIWKDFHNSVSRRKRLLGKIAELAVSDNSSEELLKAELLELRQMTLKVIEDALELEYRSQFSDTETFQKKVGVYQLPPIASFRGMEEKENLYALTDILNDTSDLLRIPSLKVILPVGFPVTRNPFLLAKTVDELSIMDIPQPHPGNTDEELRVLELMRYKRASKALLKSECQVLNRLPITLSDVESIWIKKVEDDSLAKIIRIIIALLDNNLPKHESEEPDFSSLVEPIIHLEPHEFLMKLNAFRQDFPVRIEILAGGRKLLRECELTHLVDSTSVFLIEWINSIFQYHSNSAQHFMESMSELSPSQYRSNMFTNNGQNGNDLISVVTSSEYPFNERSTELPDNVVVKVKPINRAVQRKAINQKGSVGENGNQVQKPSTNLQVNGSKKMRKQQEMLEMERKIKEEVDKALIGHGIVKKGEHELSEAEMLSSMRYELMRMQQELLRRQVLDPRHYKATSLDITAYEMKNALSPVHQSMLALSSSKVDSGIVGSSALDDMPDMGEHPSNLSMPGRRSNDILSSSKVVMGIKSKKVGATSQYALFCEREVALNGRKKGVLEVFYDFIKDGFLIKSSYLSDFDDAGKPIDIEEFEGETRARFLQYRQKESFAYMLISRLLFNRITGIDMEKILDEPIDRRLHRVHIILEAFLDMIQSFPPQTGKLVMNVNRLLYNAAITGDGVVIDLLIKRDEDCQGLILIATPFVASHATTSNLASVNLNGPITIRLSDEELQILLINQRGLFLLAQTKWSCMEIVAKWVASRVWARRLRLPLSSSQPLPPIPAMRTLTHGLDNSQDEDVEANASVVSALSEGTSRRIKERQQSSMDDPARKEPLDSDQDILANLDANHALENHLIMEENAKAPLLMEVTLDRKVELAAAALQNWKSRNISNIASMTVGMEAVQDLSMLKFLIKLSFPHPLHRRAKVGKEKKSMKLVDYSTYDDPSLEDSFSGLNEGKRNKNSNKKNTKAMKKSSNLADNDDGDDGSRLQSPDLIDSMTFPTVDIQFTHQLTLSELLVFGQVENMEEQKISLSAKTMDTGNQLTYGSTSHNNSNNSNNNNENYPSMFMWKVLSRLRLQFQGSIQNPYSSSCNADYNNNWKLMYDRRIIRDIRTVSGGVMLMTVSIVGDEILFESEPSDQSIFTRVKSKIMGAMELTEIVSGEGWPLSLLEPSQRFHLAYRILEKLKVVEEASEHRLEFYNFPESRMLKIVLSGGLHKAEIPVGAVEINDHLTLNDLRTLIRYEIDKDMIPKSYKFVYKGMICAVKQEAFRRAWELLPKCELVAKALPTPVDGAGNSETNKTASPTKGQSEDMASNNKKSKAGGAKKFSLSKDQRRAGSKLVPIPLPTLCRVQDGSPYVYLLHDSRGMLEPGDIIRFGHVRARDYIVSMKTKSIQNNYPKVIMIEPVTDMLHETDFSQPMSRNFAFPISGPVLDGRSMLKSYKQLKFAYSNLPEALLQTPTVDMTSLDRVTGGNGIPANKSALEKLLEKKNLKNPTEITNTNITTALNNATKTEDPALGTEYDDLWIWKCVPVQEDRRPRWRRLYDDGLVKYDYTYGSSREGVVHFRVKAPFRVLEVLCTDSRCLDMTIYAQRIFEMEGFSIEYYTQLAFRGMCDWFPQYKKGVDSTKFMKLMRETKAFPDIKKPTRSSQIDLLFQKEVKGDFGIVEKYVVYEGFVHLLQEVALIRFPQGMGGRDDDGGSLTGSLVDDDSLDELDDDDSQTSSPNKRGGNNGNNKKIVKTVQRRGGYMDKKFREKDDRSTASGNEPAFIDPDHLAYAYRRFILEYLIMVPDWSYVAWEEAKMIAMKKEAIRYCASTRILTAWRRSIASRRYRLFRRMMIVLQSQIRRRIATRKVRAFFAVLEEDWLFRYRYRMSTKIVSVIRRFLTRCWYQRVMKKLRDQQIIIQKAKRMRFRKIRRQEKKGIIYKEVKRVSGLTVLLTIQRKDSRNYSKDFGIIITLYIPQEQKSHKIVLEEIDLRKYMQMDLQVDVLGVGDLLDKRNLEKMLASRLIIRPSPRPGIPTQVKFSKQSLGERGQCVMTRGHKVGPDMFLCRVYETGSELSVQCYHPLTSKVFHCRISSERLASWVMEEHQLESSSLLEMQDIPEVLKKENKRQLYRWAIDRIVTSTRREKFQVMFSIQLTKNRRLESIVMIQSMIRKLMARKKVASMLNDFLIKVNLRSGDPSEYYYLNLHTGASTWEKPPLLGGFDLPQEPQNTWIPVHYAYEDSSYTHYVNPYTGKYSHLSIVRAVQMIQSMVRNHLLKMIRLTPEELRKVTSLYFKSAQQYEENSRKLSSVLNYALSSHLVDLNEELGKRLYIEAIELSEANPIVTRAFGVYMLSSCEAPLLPNRERAMRLFADAKRRDENIGRFATGYLFFKFACLKHPRSILTLLNRALVELFVYEDLAVSEKFFRRVLAMDPFDSRVVSLWNYVKDRFPEHHVMYHPVSRVTMNPGKGKSKVIHGRPVIENPEWAGWCYVKDDPYGVSKIQGPYWYFPVDGTELENPPDFHAEWHKRLQRSQYESSKMGLQYYYDPLTSSHFQYHPLTDSFQ